MIRWTMHADKEKFGNRWLSLTSLVGCKSRKLLDHLLVVGYNRSYCCKWGTLKRLRIQDFWLHSQAWIWSTVKHYTRRAGAEARDYSEGESGDGEEDT